MSGLTRITPNQQPIAHSASQIHSSAFTTMAGDFLLFDSPPLLPELIPSSPPPLPTNSRPSASTSASTASGSESSIFAYSPVLLLRTERSASVPTHEFNKIPIRKRTNEFRPAPPATYDSAGWSTTDAVFNTSNDGDIIFDRQPSNCTAPPDDPSNDDAGYWIPPHSDHPLSAREQADLLARVQEDLLGVDISALKGPLKELALSKNNAYGQDSSIPLPLSPTLLSIDDSFVGFGRTLPPNPQPPRSTNPPSSLSTLRNTPTNPNQLSPTLIGMRKRAAQETSDLSMRRTVSPQEAFLDYEDVEERYHLGRSGTSLFAPLPSPFRASPAAVPTASPSSPSSSSSTTAPIAITKKSSPSAGVKSSTALPQASPPSRTTHRPVHPFSVPQNAVNWADGGAREDESDDDDDRAEDRRAGAGKSAPGEGQRARENTGGPSRTSNARARGGPMEVDRVFSPVQTTQELRNHNPHAQTLSPSLPAPIPIVEDDEPYHPPTFVTTATSFAQRRSAAPPSPLPPAPLHFRSTSVAAPSTTKRASGTPSLASSTSGSASRSMSREISSNPFGGEEDESDEEREKEPTVHIVDLAAPPLQPTPQALPRKRSRRPASPVQPEEEKEEEDIAPVEEEVEVAPTRQSSTPRQRKKSRRTASEDDFDETLAQEDGDDDNDSNFSEASSLSPPPVTVRRPRTVISSRDFGDAEGQGQADAAQSTPQPPAPKKRRTNASGRSGNSTGTIKCPFVSTSGQVCNVPFRRPYDLARHRETIHFEGQNGKRVEWICERCKGAFSRKDALTRHGRVCKK